MFKWFCGARVNSSGFSECLDLSCWRCRRVWKLWLLCWNHNEFWSTSQHVTHRQVRLQNTKYIWCICDEDSKFSLEECLITHDCLSGNLAATLECLSASGPCRLTDHLRSSSKLSQCLWEASDGQEKNNFLISNMPAYFKCMKVRKTKERVLN